MDVIPGYKQTEVGVIPDDWAIMVLGDIGESLIGLTYKPSDVRSDGILVLRSSNIQKDTLSFDNNVFVNTQVQEKIMVRPGDILICVRNGSRDLIGKCALLDEQTLGMTFGAFMAVFRTPQPNFIYHQFRSRIIKRQIHEHLGATINQITNKSLNSFRVPLPPTKSERDAIAEALSNADALIESLEHLIVKKRQIKQGAMQELMTGKRRLPGFCGKWVKKLLEEVADCLDSLRVPLNGAQRDKMRGDYPYCGANGVLDFVNDYVIDDDIILIAEDGGYFDEYSYRTIAYRMTGKCWVNNHAHILKTKLGIDQGFVFYSLVHKNILSYLASGTRAKLNKSEMNKIELRMPTDEPEQTAIAAILSDMDTEITALGAKLAKARQIKQGMMQELLTGRIRLI